VAPGPDLVYLTGWQPQPLERFIALVVRPGMDPILVVPELERPGAASAPAGGLLSMAAWRDDADPFDMASRILRGAGRVGVSDRLWASHLLSLQAELSGATFLPGSRVLSRLRARKEPGEIELLAAAGRAADGAFARICREPLAGLTETDVARSLAARLVEEGHDSAAFTIVGAGPNGASPHHEPDDTRLHAGDPVVLDFGGRVGGYCSDITRTVVIGQPPSEVAEVHAIVREAQETAFRTVRPGIPAQQVDASAREVIEQAGYGEFFIHRTGHGIGLEEHEDPYLVDGNVEPLEVGMCFSIEPGVYLPGRFGVRIEDIVAITEDGVLRLNEAPRELVAVE
jgi:Xaa-Pro aminopeptidase